mmetsp:Transcript_10829/g.15852  ORF Transcript_10829/g.15852 Transcript_10829/m.15852 type:complete len:523 (+) Transcript_10829:391-1959(+)|eukprot:CAMPEP_0195512138 /NCGR_PEP_ID=MMETSP0794_2-20130614/4196_1 /TAXON_ID=515487 /ORGANISM="Stephanopyxis turris, Strain CCMP 815" /LENGTH=522 /DNA_ID=CAMNT_0040639861 /DNA_START=388 /DNA_END=1956 /DNA_ORIENTATION=+
MPPLRFLTCAFLAIHNVHADGTPDKVSSRLNIHIPQSLFKEEGYNHREALFGVPPYGGAIAQMLYYADSQLCDTDVDTRKGYPIRPKDKDGKMEPWPSPYVLMVDRGGCTFVQKVRNAQRSGAAGVIVADNVCLCSDGDECTSSESEAVCQQSEPIMADDGSGTDISIPAFLMYKVDADAVKAVVRANNPVQLEMAWSLPAPDDRVEYDLWTVPSDKISQDFQKSFRSASAALGSHAYFTPHMYIYDGIRSQCRGPDGESMCYNLCTNHGRYCAIDPDNDLDKGISGADVVIESLRRLCIWNHYGEEDGIGDMWWSYVNEFMFRCDTPDYFASDDCIKDVYKQTGIDATIVNNCMKNSGGTEEDKQNSILEDQIETAKNMGVVIIPTAFVNESAIRGKLSFSTLFTAVCSGFVAGSEPDICSKCSSCPSQQGCVENGSCTAEHFNGGHPVKGTVSKGTFVLTILLVCGVFGAAGYWHRKRTQSEMRDQVKGLLAEYMPLESEDGEIGSAMDFASRQGTQEIS